MLCKKLKRGLSVAGSLLGLGLGVGIAQAAGVSHYAVTNLVSDTAVTPPAATTDPNLQNAWGVAYIPGGPIWINDNGTGLSTLYDGTGAMEPSGTPLVVTIPIPTGSGLANALPTGMVWNANPFLFTIPSTNTGALFIFSTEDGTISAWNLALSDLTKATLMVDNPDVANGPVYKGLALGNTSSGEMLYATDFHGAKIDVFDSTFAPVSLPAGAFTDSKIPGGPSCDPTAKNAKCFAPFGIANIRGNLFISYALQDATKHDDVKGKGNGYIDVYDTSGNLVQRFAAKGKLNSPWGMVEAPWNFGSASGSILVGNFGDGAINILSSTNGAAKGQLMDSSTKKPLTIDGLWGLTFGGFQGADPGTLYFTAGPNDEADGLFGSVTPQ